MKRILDTFGTKHSASVTGLSRRHFLQLSAIAGGGIMVGFHLPEVMAGTPVQMPHKTVQPNAFVRITADNWITVIVGHTEMGQGVTTIIPMLVAEEMDADWQRVRWEQAPTAPAYQNPLMHQQLTGGSLTTIAQYEPQRKAGAAVREVMLAAAAKRWHVDVSSLRTDTGRVIHDASDRSATYGELAVDAVGIEPPANPKLKDPKNFKIIGKPLRRIDAMTKVDGSGKFGMDAYVPGMLIAVLARPPLFGGKISHVDATVAKAMPNVVGVYETPQGVAVVAKDFWSAKRARDALVLMYSDVNGERVSTDEQRIMYRHLMSLEGTVARSTGDIGLAQRSAAKTFTADYWFPYLTHAPMEPLNATIDYRGGNTAEVWMSTQWPEGDQHAAASVLGLKPEQVKLNTLLTGGGFGRRSSLGFDVIIAAAHIAKAVRRPVKMIWTRDQDIQGGYYRPSAYHRLSATLDSQGTITSWTNRIAVQSIGTGTVMERFIVKNGIDSLSVEGAEDIPYAIPNLRVDLHTPRFQVPVLWMRSVGHSHTAFAVEHFLEEIAHGIGKDPYQMRRELLQEKPRHLATLDAVAKLANWSTQPKAGIFRGIVVHESYGSFVGTVVEASVATDQTLTVHKVYSVIDCGVAVNPDLVKAQMESSIAFGLSSALYGEITLNKGEVQQGNYDDYPVVRMSQMPQIETMVVESAESPGGAGEPGVAGVAPALANAILWATGQPVRSLPLRHSFRVV
ncbi:isoquinoline 1-oxidoreductase beta subunit [Pseudomonas chlororaphis]